ncbi:MAG: tetratricopeptide repeat protein [Planctomycetaceae bacterium]|nr:tetratricopeptide repeat protein [Planctomycetaceae bacterium]
MARKEKLRQMLQSDPNDPFLNYALAQEYLSADERPEAIKRFRDVIHRFPDYHAAHFQLGQILAEEGSTDEAIQTVTSGIEAAKQAGDRHAVSEMTEFLQMLGDQ